MGLTINHGRFVELGQMDQKEFRAYWKRLLRQQLSETLFDLPTFVLIDDYDVCGACAVATAETYGGILAAWRWWEGETDAECHCWTMYWDAENRMFRRD